MADALPCFVPARLGSKRVPRKNLLAMAGKPMLDYTLEAAIEASGADRVVLCTEAEEIAEAARRHPEVEVHLVPPDLCEDHVPSWRPCVRAWHELGRPGPGALLCLQPTSPLRNAADIDAGVRCFLESGRDFATSVTPIDPHYFHWALCHEEGSDWRMAFGDEYLQEGVVLPPRWRPNGSVKIAGVEALERTGHFFGPSLACFETPEQRSIHVGTHAEFEMAELLLAARQAR